MSRQQPVKFSHEVDMQNDTVAVARPFRLQTDERRRYIRLDISTPMALRKIKDIGGRFFPRGDRRTIDGLILNISASGVLVEVTEPVNEGDVVVMQFTLQDVEQLEHVLGLVKRSDTDGDGYLVGIEFVTRRALADIFTELEMNELSPVLSDFDEQVRTVLNKYIRSGHTAGDNGR